MTATCTWKAQVQYSFEVRHVITYTSTYIQVLRGRPPRGQRPGHAPRVHVTRCVSNIWRRALHSTPPHGLMCSPGDEAVHARHAQAVRFITSLRSEAKDPHIPLTQEHIQFLHSKGLSDADIDRARKDAERPEYANMSHAFNEDRARVTESSDTKAFGKAEDAFRDEGRAPQPPVPSYPRSPLALYSMPETEQLPPSQYDTNQVLAEYAASVSRPRYDTLVSFLRTLHFLLIITGGATAFLVAVFRRFLIPKLTSMIDARVDLLSTQKEQFRKVGEALSSIRAGYLSRLLPKDYEPTWTEVQVNEEVSTPPDTEALCDVPPKTTIPDGRADAPDTTSPMEEQELAPAPQPRRVLAPIDITQSVRDSLDQLAQSLRHAAVVTSGSVTESDDEGLLDLWSSPRSPPDGKAASTPADPIAMGPSASMASFRHTFESVRNELRASVLSDENSMNMIGSRFSAFTQPSARPTSGPAVEMLQMKAEIRSLKGLLLSRRNFPSFMRTARASASVDNGSS